MTSPYLTAKEAAIYLRYKNEAGVRMAVSRGWLRAAGRGPRNMLLFRRSDLDAFLNEIDPEAITPLERAELQPLKPPAIAGIYFAVCGGRCKIGKARDIRRRLKSLMTPEPVQLVAFIEEKEWVERHMHDRFAPLREHGEWFRFEGELVEFVRELRGK